MPCDDQSGYEKVSVLIDRYVETRKLKKVFRDEQYFAK